MKTLIISVILLFTLNTIIMAKDKPNKQFQIERTLIIDVSATDLWQLVGHQFAEAHLWATGVDHSEGRGIPQFEGATCSERFCKVNASGFDQLAEKLYHYSDSDMNLAYEVYAGMPSFVSKATNDWTVVPVDDHRSKLVMKANFEVKGLMGTLMKGMMKKKAEKLLDEILEDARVYATTGHPSKSKQERLDQLAKKKEKLVA